MAATNTEKMLSHRNKRSGILVPLLEDLFAKPVQIESLKDEAWVHSLLLKRLDRERERESRNVYSPSSLASCMRQVYFSRHHKELGIKKHIPIRPETNYYFATGDWAHLKWQFALYKLNQKLSNDEFFLRGVEVGVISKHGDHGGTLDALVCINGIWYVVDFKTANVRAFAKAEQGDVSHQYEIQISDYGMLVNSDRELKKYGEVKVESGLIIFENKGGPTNKCPIALHEVKVSVKDHLPEIKYRLEELRDYEASEEIPPPECESIRETQFTGCAFRKYCKIEVQAKTDSGDSAKHSVAIPSRKRPSRSK